MNNVELQTHDIKSMPVIFFDDSTGSQEVIIRDDAHILDALPFNEQEINSKDFNITGLTILKQEIIENVHAREKVVLKGLKPLSINNYINLPKQSDKTMPKRQISKLKVSQKQKKFNYNIDSEEIYKMLMDSD